MSEPSGRDWCNRFPGSQLVSDLATPFRERVENFLAALRAAAPAPHVAINATLRPAERAYLMHFAWQIAHGAQPPETVPPMAGVDIIWAHPAALSAAQAMVDGYQMSFIAALMGNHTRGLAIDMNVTWVGSLTVTDAGGNVRTIGNAPRDNGNPQLQDIARTFGVLKLTTDFPHWSVDGH